ncbi:UPF0426 protein [Platanthera guangdongensis]|uniref:UPF0426 protein n=1 Tax=Platanthera guangdongensis TaxID=2320717 RepID=A0ABR2LVC5_9ASPA
MVRKVGLAFSPRSGRVGLKVQDRFNPFVDQPTWLMLLRCLFVCIGRMFVGLLRLDLNEDPLNEWIVRSMKPTRIKHNEEAEVKVDRKKDFR